MATKLYLNSASATGAVPNAKQSADTINRDVASSYATYAVPAKMTITAGGNNRLNETTAAEPGSAHYTHYGTWVSDQLAAQTVSGTVTIALSLNEGNSLANANPRVKIYKWLANDTFGSDLLALTTSGTEAPSTYTLTTFFSGTAITSTTFAAGDRIVIEVETYDNNTRTSSYLHGIQFDGADAGVYGSYVSFSADITFPTAYTKTVTTSEVGVRTLIKRVKKIVTTSEVGVRNLAYVHGLIQRKLNAGSFTDLVKVVFGSNAYADSYNLSGGNTYYYRLAKYINGVSQGWSNEVSVSYTSGGANYKTITGTVVGVRANIKRVGKIITKSEVAARTLIRKVGKIVTVPEVAARTLLKRLWKPITKSEVGSANLIKQGRKVLSKAVTSYSSLTKIFKWVKTVTQIVVGLRSLRRRIGKPITQLETGAVSIRRRINKIVSKSSAFIATLISIKGLIYKILTPSKPELITNGDFETGNMTGWTYLNFGVSAGGGFGTYSCLSNDDNAYLYQNLDTSQGLNISWYQKYTVTSGGSLTLSVDSAQIGTYPLLSNSMTLYKVIIDPLAGTHSIKWTFTQGATDWVAIDNISAKRPAFIPSVRRRIGKPIIQFETGVTSLRRRINKIVSKVSAFVSILISQKLAGLIFKTISIAGVGVRSLIKRTGKPIIKTESAVVTLIKRTGKNVVWLEAGVAVLRRRIGKPIIKLEVGYTSLRRTIRKIISKVSSFVATLRRMIGKPIIKAETGIVSLRRKIGKLLAKVSTFVATLGLSGYVAIYYKTLTTVMASQVSLRRRISKTLSKIVSSVVRMWHDYFPGGWVDDTKRVTLHCKFSPQADVICKWDSTVTVGCNFEIPSITLRCWMDRGV